MNMEGVEVGEAVDYGVATKNVFDLLGSDGDGDLDPADLIAQAQARKKAAAEQAAKAKRQAKASAKAAPKGQPAGQPPPNAPKANLGPARTSPPNPNGPRQGNVGGPGGPRGGPGRFPGPRDGPDGGPRGPRGPRGPAGPPGARRPFPQQAQNGGGGNDFAELNNGASEAMPPSAKEAGGANFGGGFAGARSGGGGPGAGGPGGMGGGRGRQFDRRSGMDRQAGDKRGGAGKGNWGTAEDELKGETEPLPASGDEEKKENGEEKAEGDEKPKEVKEEEPRQLTLDEWRAAQGNKAKPAFNIRKAGEGEGKKKEWSKLVPLQRSDDPLVKNNDDEYIVLEKPSKKKELNLNIRFNDGNRSRGPGPRRVAPTMGPKPHYAQANVAAGGTFRVDDQSFPSLS